MAIIPSFLKHGDRRFFLNERGGPSTFIDPNAVATASYRRRGNKRYFLNQQGGDATPAPGAYGDIIVWLNAGVISASDGTGLSKWTDSGPLNKNVTSSTATTTDQPKYKTNIINGLPAVQFGTGSFKIAPFGTSSAAELWVVMKSTYDPTPNVAYEGPVFMTSASAGAEAVPFTDGKLYEPFFSAQATNAHTAISKSSQLTTASLYNVVSENNHMNISFRGEIIYASDTNPVPGNGAWGTLSHSVGDAGGATNWPGLISELIVYGKKLNSAERNKTVKYLVNKYNLTYIQDTASLNPSSISASNLLGWWDANKVSATSNSSSVSSWTDLSGNGNHLTQSVAAKQPVLFTSVYNSMPTLRFTSSAYFFGTTSPFVQGSNSQFTFMVVCKPTAADSSVLAHNSANIQFRTREGNANQNNFFPGTNELTSTGFTKAVGTLQLNVWTRSNTGVVNMWQNGFKSATGTNGTSFTWNRVADGTVNTVPFIGDITEMAWWNYTLTDFEIYKLYELYFRPKWGLPG
jgi:hypothetical protein